MPVIIEEAAVKEEAVSPAEELKVLEEEALRLGMSPEQLARIRGIGYCPDQVKTRIIMLQRWISSRLS